MAEKELRVESKREQRISLSWWRMKSRNPSPIPSSNPTQWVSPRVVATSISWMHPVTECAYGGGLYGTEKGSSGDPRKAPASHTQSADGPEDPKVEPKHMAPAPSTYRLPWRRHYGAVLHSVMFFFFFFCNGCLLSLCFRENPCGVPTLLVLLLMVLFCLKGESYVVMCNSSHLIRKMRGWEGSTLERGVTH